MAAGRLAARSNGRQITGANFPLVVVEWPPGQLAARLNGRQVKWPPGRMAARLQIITAEF
jgi:Ser/Thr protein kinase RdoA (MazF antagonist)